MRRPLTSIECGVNSGACFSVFCISELVVEPAELGCGGGSFRFARRYANMPDSWQDLSSEQPDRFQRFLFSQTRSTERDIDNADAGLLMEIRDLLHYCVGTSAKL